MNYDSVYWDRIAQRMTEKAHYLDDAIGRQKRQVHLQLFRRWLDGQHIKTVLKTDLFEEAFGPDHLLSDLHTGNNLVIGMDISPIIVGQAKERMNSSSGLSACYVVCDVRHPPFADGSLDLIISNSTLDHFSTRQEIAISLNELSRCLYTGGFLIVTLDNGSNFFGPLLRLLARLGGPYHIGPTFSIRDLTANLKAAGLTVTDTSALIHNPRVLITIAARLLRILCPGRAEHWIENMLHLFAHLDGWRTRYLTACFIAARATKLSTDRC